MGKASPGPGLATASEQAAELLHTQNANPCRVQAYDQAANTLRSMARPLVDILEAEGVACLPTLRMDAGTPRVRQHPHRARPGQDPVVMLIG